MNNQWNNLSTSDVTAEQYRMIQSLQLLQQSDPQVVQQLLQQAASLESNKSAMVRISNFPEKC